jgi:phage-related baseplate assembly protein
MSKMEIFESLPEIDLLKDEGITYDSIIKEMSADFETQYEKLTGEELTLYPADERKLLLNTCAGKIYQMMVILNERFKLNFIQYMFGDYLKNWGANFGYSSDGTEPATVTLRFHLSSTSKDVTIPAGTRATCGDRVYFATNTELNIPAGTQCADVSATCTQVGTTGNGYTEGQINILADPIDLVESVENTTESSGGHDAYTDMELKELIYNFPSTYSTAGPKEGYEELTKTYSGNIADVRAVANDECVVQIYVLLLNGELPDETYCRNIKEYLDGLGSSPDTDKIEVYAPEQTTYEISVTYYISEDKKSVETAIKETVEDAVNEFASYTASKIGRAIIPDTLVGFAKAAGASRIEIKEPTYRAIGQNQVAVCTKISLKYGGIEAE